MRHSPTHRISDKRAGHTGRHRLVVDRVYAPTRESLHRVLRSRSALAVSALACLALAATAGDLGGTHLGAKRSDTVAASLVDAPDPARVVLGRLAPERVGVLDQAEEEARRAEKERLAAEAAWRAANPTPVGGLDQAQMNNAMRIVQAGQAMGLPKRAFVIAVATAMQESRLYNLASTRIPASYNYPNEGSGSDHDSVGLFQQRASSGWGRVQDLMNPFYSASAFYNALIRVPGWDAMALTRAAQRVQVSAYPSAYAKHEPLAQLVVDALVPTP